jgi:hypothetical protein
VDEAESDYIFDMSMGAVGRMLVHMVCHCDEVAG